MYGKSLYGQSLYGTNINDENTSEEYYIDLLELLPTFLHEIKQINELQKILSYQVGRVIHENNNIVDQCFVKSATWGLDRWEQDFGIATDKSKSYEFRREVLLAKLRGAGTTSKEMIKNVAIAFSGGEVEIEEYPDESYFVIQFVGIKGIPPNMAGLIKAIDEIKPAHLAYSFKYTYTTWGALDGFTWELAKKYTWAGIKIYEGDD